MRTSFDTFLSFRRRLAERFGWNTTYDRSNPLRIESAIEAHGIDERIAIAWADHPRRFEIVPASSFLAKAARAVEILRGELPDCCRRHLPLPEIR
jgi:hypothetical protein